MLQCLCLGISSLVITSDGDKVSKSESEENQRLKNKNLQLTNENAALKVKLAEVHRHAKDNELIHSKLKDEYNELNNKLEKLKNSFGNIFLLIFV